MLLHTKALFLLMIVVHTGSAKECTEFTKRIDRLGLTQWSNTNVITPANNSRVAMYGIMPLVGQDFRVRELASILGLMGKVSNEVTTDKLKLDLAHWARRHSVGVEFVWPDDFQRLGLTYIQSGKLPKGTRLEQLVQGNGYINDKFFNLMIADGYWPLADPHDLVGHAPQLLIPSFLRMMQRKARLSIKCRDLSQTNDRLTGAANLILQHLGTEIRNTTWENLVYLSDSLSKPDLIVQGNSAYGILDSVRFLASKRISRSLSATLMGNEIGERYPDLKKLPRFEEYCRNRSEAFQAYERAASKVGRSDPGRGEATNKLLQLQGKILKELPAESTEDRFIEMAMSKLALEISTDSQLRTIFNKENRIELLKSALDLYEDYLEWAGKN